MKEYDRPGLTKIKKITIREKIEMRILGWFIARFLVRAGPVMFHIKDYWLFIDHYGTIWKITYTGRYDGIPLMIERIDK